VTASLRVKEFFSDDNLLRAKEFFSGDKAGSFFLPAEKQS